MSVVKQFQLGKTCDQPENENVVSNGEIFNSSLSRSGTYTYVFKQMGEIVDAYLFARFLPPAKVRFLRTTFAIFS